MEVVVLYSDSSFGPAWFWHYKKERLAHGPFQTEAEAKANAMQHYDGATLRFLPPELTMMRIDVPLP